MLSRYVTPRVAGVGAILLATLLYTTTQSAFDLAVYNRFLLACLGAIALNMLMGTAGQVSVGNAAFLLLGAMGSVAFLRVGVAFPLDTVLAAVVCVPVGAIVAATTVRLKGLFFALATLALVFIVRFVAARYQGHSPEAANGGFFIAPLFGSHGLLGAQRYGAWLLCALVCVLVVATSLLVRDRTGRAWRTIRDHELIAATFGIDVMRYKLTAFVLSSFTIGVAGGLTAHLGGLVTVDQFTLLISIQYLAMILIGGLDSIAGAVIGAAIVVVLPTYVPTWTAPLFGSARAAVDGPQVAQIIYGVLVVVFVTFSPDGIAGWIRDLLARVRTRRAAATRAS